MKKSPDRLKFPQTHEKEFFNGNTSSGELIAAAVILNGLISDHGKAGDYLTTNIGSHFLTKAAEITKLLGRELQRSTIRAHAFQLFHPGEVYSLQKAANIFRKAKWKGLTSKESVSNLFNEVYKSLKILADDSLNLSASSLHESGESAQSALEHAHLKDRRNHELSCLKQDESFIAHDLFRKAQFHRIKDDRLMADVHPDCIVHDRDVPESNLSDGEPIHSQFFQDFLMNRIRALERENTLLKESLEMSQSPKADTRDLADKVEADIERPSKSL